MDALRADGIQQWIATRAVPDLSLPELHHARVVPGPARDRAGERSDLARPRRTVRVDDLGRPHEADVDVAVRRAVAACGAPEEIGDQRPGVPATELRSEPPEQ